MEKQTRKGKDYITLKSDPLYINIKKLIIANGVSKEEFNVIYVELLENTVRLQKMVRRIYTTLDEIRDLYNITSTGQYKKNPLLAELKSLSGEVRNHLESIVKLTKINDKDSASELKSALNEMIGKN